MSRRRLRTVYTSSSDEEEDNLQQPQTPNPNPNPNIPHSDHLQPQHQIQNSVFDESMLEEYDEIETPSQTLIPNIDSVTLNSSHSTPTTTTATTAIPEPPSVGISDEEFLDVSETLSSSNPPPSQPASASFIASDCPVNDILRRLGLNLRREWLDSCKLGLQNSVSGFANFDIETKAKLCFGQFLNSDMNYVGAGILPENVHQLHLVDLPGPFVLQVDEITNISCPLRERYKNASAGPKRCLKLSMTDGVQCVFGMEYRPIRSLEALAPAGFKVVIRNVNVRRGLLMLVPEVLDILGGSVEELEAARQRLVHEVNKPPKGKRTRNGIVPPLSTRATLAAWGQTDASNITMPPNDANDVSGNAANSMPHAAAQFQESTAGVSMRSRPAPHAGSIITEPSNLGRFDQRSLSSTDPSNLARSDQCSLSREFGQKTAQLSSIGNCTTKVSEPLHGRESAVRLINRETAQGSVSIDAHGIPTSTDAPQQVLAGECTEIHSTSAAVNHSEDAHLLDYMENPFILSRDNEMPFTYLASLSAKWDAVQENEPSVRGKIKCFLTGVKKFSYKGRATFKLEVHVDDGSLISEVLIHHDVVQKAIGYSPKEVSAAFSSSDAAVTEDMRNTLKRFQIFLINFEGTMLLELNATSMFPVALEMNQGCSTSDAWSLLQRLKPDTSRPLSQNGQSDVINLSP